MAGGGCGESRHWAADDPAGRGRPPYAGVGAARGGGGRLPPGGTWAAPLQPLPDPAHSRPPAPRVPRPKPRAGRPGLRGGGGPGCFGVGDGATGARGQAYMRDYYAFAGPFAEKIVAGLLTTPQALAQFVRGYAEAGCDELVLLPAVAELAQVERLADLVGS